MKTQILRELQTIPGIGRQIAKYLYDLGIRSVADLKDKKPEALYDQSNRLALRLCAGLSPEKKFRRIAGVKQDRCLLYVFRCAVYFSKTKHPKPKLLKWWNWKDKP